MNTTIESLRRQLQQLQALHDSGSLSAEAYAEARVLLERALLDQVMQVPPAAPRPSRRLQAGLVAGVLVLAAVGYAITGSPGRLTAPAETPALAGGPAADGNPPVGDAQVADIVERVAQRLKDKPDDPAGWALLARAYAAMGRLSDAAPAFQKALALAGDDANLLADYADTLAALNNGKISPETMKLVDRALVLEPENTKALALAGSYAFDNREFATAVRLWEKVERSLPAESEFLVPVRASIARARELGGMPPAAPVVAAAGQAKPAAAGAGSAPPAAAAGPGAKPAGAIATAVSGSVTLAPALAGRAGPDDTLFVLARAATGPRMPLAVLRKQVKDLPLNFTLDDSMAMAPNARISDHPLVVISVRISKSGDAMPQNGDLRGESAPVAPGTRGIAIQISEVLSR
jgi:cytochrome c-type biogenesis protein CcmH